MFLHYAKSRTKLLVMPDSEPTPQQPWIELKKLRDDLALTLAEMSVLTGYSLSHLSDLERGRRRPGPRVVAQIARRTGRSRESLQPAARAAA